MDTFSSVFFQDFCYALIKAEMDTDFEDECKDIRERREKLEKQLAESPDHPVTAAAAPSKEPETPQTQQRRKKPRKRISSWARGEVRKKPRREKAEEEGEEGEEEPEGEEEQEGEDDAKEKEDDSPKANSAENSLSHSPRATRRRGGGGGSPPSVANAAHIPAAAEMVPTSGVRIDQSRLQQVTGEAVRLTEGFTVERLERVLAAMMAAVAPYRARTDRTQLPADLQRCLDTLKTQRTPSSARGSSHRH